MAAIDDLSNLLSLLSDPAATKKLAAEFKEHVAAKRAADEAVRQVKVEKASLNDMQSKIDHNNTELLKKQQEHARAVAKHQEDVASHNVARAALADDRRALEIKARDVAAKEGSFRDWESRLRAMESKLEADRADVGRRLNVIKQAAS